MIGKIISHYKILEKLGEGGMGVVYKARDIKLDRFVALKFLPTHLTKEESDLKRFLQEAKAAAALNHPNVCTIYEIHDEGENPFIVMEYVEGKTLRQNTKEKRQKIKNVIGYTIQIAEALKVAHSKGIIHRDIKSENIMVTETGQVKVMDFGLARMHGSVKLTKTGYTTGTTAYMSPEQFEGKRVDHRTDIWSLGVVLYEMITGQLPFKGEYEQSVMYSIMNENPEPITLLRTEVSEGLQRIVEQALKKNPDDRYQCGDEIIADLKTYSKESETSAGILSSPIVHKLTRHTLIRRCAFAALIVVFVLLGYLLIRPLLFQEVWVGEPRPILVISFENQTGDKTYDYLKTAIPNLLITSLEQSKYLQVITWERMYDLLRQIGRKNVEIIDRDLGFELCLRDGVDVIVTGSFIKAENMFATDVKVLDVKSKKLLKSVSAQGRGVESILKKQIDELSKEISRSMGISEQRIEVSQKPIIDVTTTSFDAYNLFLKGREHFEKLYYDDARQLLEQAVELDSSFAEAYLYLSWIYNDRWNFKQRDAMYEKAKSLSEKAPEKAQLYIEAFNANFIENNLDKLFRILLTMEQKYPREKRIYYSMGNYYMKKGLYGEAITEFKKALKLDPDYGYVINQIAYCYSHMSDFENAILYFTQYASLSPGDANPHDSMGDLYLKMSKLEKAIDEYNRALELKPDFGSEWKIAYIFALKRKYTESLKWMDQFIVRTPHPVSKAVGYIWRGFYDFWTGNFQKALKDLDSAEELSRAVNSDLWEAWTDWMRAWIYLEQHNYKLSRKSFLNWLNIMVENFPSSSAFFRALYSVHSGYLYLQQGQIDSLKSTLSIVNTLMVELSPESRNRIFFRYQLLQAEVFLQEDDADMALSVLEKTPWLGILPNMLHWYVLPYNAPFLKDVLARVYLSKGEIDNAIEEYNRLIIFDGSCKDHLLSHPKYNYRLAKLYQDKGLSEKAIEQYRKFLEFWKEADDDLPELVDARLQLTRLEGDT